MVKSVQNKPKAFDYVTYPMFWFELSDDAGIYGWGALDFWYSPLTHLRQCFVHLEVERWTHNVLKELEKDWITAKEIINTFDCNNVVLTKLGSVKDQQSYGKLIKFMGFKQSINLTMSFQEI